MRRRIFYFLTAPLAIVTIVLLVLVLVFTSRFQQYESRLNAADAAARSNAEIAARSGRDFEVEGVPVRSAFIGLPQGQPPQDEVHRGDSLVLVYRLDSRTRGDETLVANEAGGHLTPTLTAGDCAVTAQTTGLTKATKQPLAAFVWQWSIDDCKTVGYKAVQLLVAFDEPRGRADPVADRELGFVHVTDPFSWNDVLTVIGVATGTLSILSVVVGLFGTRKAEDKGAT